MTIDEEIAILENALQGALLVPSECAFVSTEIIKICLDTLRTYESWEDLIRYEIEKEVRSEALDEFVKELEKCVAMQWVDIHDIWEIQEKLKEQKQ